MANNKVVVKALNVLTLFEEHTAVSLNEVVQLTGAPKTSVIRMLNSLIELGFLTKTGSQYMLGLPLLHYGQLVAERLDVRRVALPFMNKLRDEINETVALIIPNGEEGMYVEKVDTSQMARVYTRVGRRAPYYAGACPRILLAFMPEERQREYVDSIQLKAIASGTITDRNKLRDVLEKSRARGYSMSFSELEDGAAAIAAPVFNYQRQIEAALSIMGPIERFKRHEHDVTLIERVKDHARDISTALGWIPEGQGTLTGHKTFS